MPQEVIESQVVRIADLVLGRAIINEIDFRNCLIVGPAVIALIGSSVTRCTFSASIDAMFWLIPSTRPVIVGAVGVENCHFEICRFENIGFAGPQELLDMFQADLG